MQPDDTIAKPVLAAAQWLQHLPPGPLAEIRRMTEEDPAPGFWRLASRYPNSIGSKNKQLEWISIVRILAVLTEKGEVSRRRPLHDNRNRLGAALCDGGEPSWPGSSSGDPRPVYSERRLAQLMSARGRQRAVLLERAARILARNRSPGVGINVVDIAYALLNPNNPQDLAAPYYRRLDLAEYAAEQSEEGTQS